jgi:hypothetical protein
MEEKVRESLAMTLPSSRDAGKSGFPTLPQPPASGYGCGIIAVGTKERQILAEPRQGRKAATVGEFLWVF